VGGSDDIAVRARNARREAEDLVGGELDPRVLEPSPPAVTDGPWYADDPTAGGNVDWHEWLRTHPEHGDWLADRWLAGHRRLPAAPGTIVETRLALHRLAVYVVSPARQRAANGKMGLRWTLGGFGTPFFGVDEQVRVAGTTFVRQRGTTVKTAAVTTLADGATLVLDGPPDGTWAAGLDVPAPGDVDEKLPVDSDAARFLGDWYGFAWSVLEELRREPASADPSRVQLWPEHFDAAFDCLPEARRATFGASPGDAAVAEPYLYVTSAGVEAVPSDLWNASTFRGAILPLAQLVDADDQRAHALEFFRARRGLLTDD
jgi:hypothetical protein